jgi:ubiquinone/menaquinone biosynthesis C-methylase UbiE
MAHRCPVWAGYFLLNPLRRLTESPRARLGPLVRDGMIVLEPGPGMGFFTLDVARMVGGKGRVVAVDVQEGMVERLRRRVLRAGLENQVEVRLARTDSLGVQDLAGCIDLALAIYVVHEVDDKRRFFDELKQSLKPGGRLLVVEPPLHVSRKAFDASLEVARRAGFRLIGRPHWLAKKTALFEAG